MVQEIKRYPVRHPLLRKYIRFFWELHADYLQLNHKLIPQRNINMRFNLGETHQYLSLNGTDNLLDEVFFSGLQDQYTNANLKLNGRVDILGICFYPDGFYPFLGIPVSEFKNQTLGAREVGFRQASTINEQLKEAHDAGTRIEIIENLLIAMLPNEERIPQIFRQIFDELKQNASPVQLTEFCRCNNIGIRNLERMYNKYVGVTASTYGTLNRFHNSMNQLLINDYSRFSDLAFDNGYFDQMHFIREFKRFAGNTPKNFVKQNNSILNIGKLS